MLAPMFYLAYIVSELRRRKGRTLLTALGLGVGVGLVVTVSALTTGLDRAQEKVLAPLTGVGTDMAVTRPVKARRSGPRSGRRGASTSASRREPGERFTRTDFLSGAQQSFPGSSVAKVAAIDGVEAAAGSLTRERGDDQGHRAGGRLRTAADRSAARRRRAPRSSEPRSTSTR